MAMGENKLLMRAALDMLKRRPHRHDPYEKHIFVPQSVYDDALRYGLGASMNMQPIDLLDFYERTDPMQISLRLREINNGVLAQAGDDEVYGTSAGETFFPNLEAAYAAAPKMLAEAHARATAAVSGKREIIWPQRADKEPERVSDCVSGAATGPIPSFHGHAATFISENEAERLPEEAAALRQPVPSDPPVPWDDETSESVQAIHVEPVPPGSWVDPHQRGPIAADPLEQGEPAFTIGATRPLPDQDDDQVGRDVEYDGEVTLHATGLTRDESGKTTGFVIGGETFDADAPREG